MFSLAIIGGADGPTKFYLGGENGGLIDIPMLILAIVIAYAIGNISPSIMLAKAKGIDIKKEGSGNAGTTNALRVMGKKAGVITLIVDVLKGTCAVLLGGMIGGYAAQLLCVVAVACGHIWPVIYKFKGGKGVATIFGAIMGLNPLLGLSALAIVAVVVLISKRMSVGSIFGAVCFPFLAYFIESDFLIPGIVLAAIVVIKHRGNIVRLAKGQEPVMSIFDKKKKTESDEDKEC